MDKIIEPIVPPIHLSTIFSLSKTKKNHKYEYSRIGNPTRDELESKLARLEKGKFALSFSSATAASATLLALLSSGDHILCSQDLYEGTFRLLQKVFSKFNISFDSIDFNNHLLFKKSLKDNTKLIWFENLTNPLLKEINTSKIANLSKKTGSLILVDNTFSTPIFKNPLKEGADIVLHSLTKFIGGHHDLTAGAVIMNNAKLFEKLKFLQHTIGSIPSPFDCFLILRSIKSLKLRMEKHKINALFVSKFLKSQKKIAKVSFPGFSGLVSFWIKGSKKKTIRFLTKLTHIKTTQSLGGPETIVQHPRTMINFSLPPNKLDNLGITDNLIRMSVGLEEESIIINDLKQALKQI